MFLGKVEKFDGKVELGKSMYSYFAVSVYEDRLLNHLREKTEKNWFEDHYHSEYIPRKDFEAVGLFVAVMRLVEKAHIWSYYDVVLSIEEVKLLEPVQSVDVSVVGGPNIKVPLIETETILTYREPKPPVQGKVSVFVEEPWGEEFTESVSSSGNETGNARKEPPLTHVRQVGPPLTHVRHVRRSPLTYVDEEKT